MYEDMDAYKQLYDILFDGLHRFSYAFVKSNEAAEEIVSDVFIKVWQIRGRLAEIENFAEYLYIITKNFSLNYLAKNYKNIVITLDELELETSIEIKNPEELCISADIMDSIRGAIEQLSPKCRLIFQMVREENLKYKEVATILGISVFTVRNQVALATQKVAKLLPDYIMPPDRRASCRERV